MSAPGLDLTALAAQAADAAEEFPQTLDAALDLMRLYVRLNSPADDLFLMLAMAHDALSDLFPSTTLLHIAFAGDKSGGKSNITRFVTWSMLGKFLDSATPAALIRTLKETGSDSGGAPIGLDELDDRARSNPELADLLRCATSRGAVHRTSIPVKEGWKNQDVPIGRTFVFNMRGEVEDALQSRTLIFEPPQSYDEALIARWEADMASGAALRLNTFLRREVKRAEAAGWTKDRARGRFLSPAFLLKVRTFTPRMPRSKGIAMKLALTAEILEWPITANDILANIEAQEARSEEFAVEFEALRLLFVGNPAGGIAFNEALQAVNLTLKDSNLRPYNGRTFPKVLRAAGFTKGKTWGKGTTAATRARVYLTLDRKVRRALGLPGSPDDSPDPFTPFTGVKTAEPDGGGFTRSPDSPVPQERTGGVPQ